MDTPEDIGVPTGEPTPGEKIPKPPQKGAAGKAKKAAGDAAGKAAKKGLKMAAKAAARAIAHAAVAAFNAIVGVVGWPVVVGCLIITLIILLIFGSLAAHYLRGGAGKTAPQRAGRDDPNIAKVLALTQQETGESGSGNMKLNFLHQRDLEYIQSGEIDRRLLAALVYLAERHEHIRVSHIVSVYEDMKTNVESGSFHDVEKGNNISAHKDGLAADIDEIDYLKDKCDCGAKIPVKVSWQTIGENPFATAPDALNKIDSPESFANEEVKNGLKEMGVTGLDQADLIEKMKASATLSQIDNVFDLTNPNVIAAFEAIGVSGLGNQALQDGLKRLQAIQQIYELHPDDVTDLYNPQVQSLLGTIGIGVSEELIDSIEKYQATQIVQQIKSLTDLRKPEVQKALQELGVDTNDPNFQKALSQMTAAKTIANWQGDYTSPALLDALGQFDITIDNDVILALNILKAANKTFNQSGTQINNDVAVIQTLEQLAIFTNNPELQDVIKKYKAAYKISNYQGDYTSLDFAGALSDLGFTLSDEQKKVLDQYKASQYILNYQGDLTNPQFLASLETLGVTLTDQNKEYIEKIKATEVLAAAAEGKIPLDSQMVKDALDKIGASSIEDQAAKAAIKVGQAKDPDDPNVQKEKEFLGLTKEDALNLYAQFKAAKTLAGLHDYTSLQDPIVQKNLQTLGLKDPKYYEALNKIGAVTGLLSVHNLSDLQKPGVQNSLQSLGIKNPKYYDAIGKLGSLQTLLQVHSLKDLQSPYVQEALKNLGVKDPKIYENIGKLSSIYTLLEVNSVWDLTQPQVIDALSNLGLADAALQGQLKNAGAIYTLTQIKEPADLLKPQSLQALDQLGIIDLNAELFGQIGALQTLLAVDSFEDLLNPNTILALNTLGIISLSNPVTMALMALVFLDNILGGSLLGGLFGDDCDANTDCYKPTAQENVYKVTEELLQMPYDLGDKEQYRVTQLIVYSLEYIRSKDPGLDSKLDQLYWPNRRPNVGLFTMPEAWQNIHIGY